MGSAKPVDQTSSSTTESITSDEHNDTNNQKLTTSSSSTVVAPGTHAWDQLSKRQRRKVPNPKQKWSQQPKIKSPAARARAYLIDANLRPSDRKKDDLLTLDMNSPEMKFGRLLGGTDQRARHAAVNKLGRYLTARADMGNTYDNEEGGGISELDLMKLWKGLWYTLFMADRVPVQDELSKRLSKLIWCLAGTEEEDEYAGQVYLDMDETNRDFDGWDEDEEGEEGEDDEIDDADVTMEEIVNTLDDNREEEGSEESEDDDTTDSDDDTVRNRDDRSSEKEEGDDEEEKDDDHDPALVRHCRGAHLASLFVRTFFRTMRREWGNIDKHRVDKFYTAVRLMISEVYNYMSTRHWNLGIIRLFNDTLYEEVLSHTPNGLRYHLIDITLTELATVNSTAPLQLTEATFLDCLEPYFALIQTVPDKIVHDRVMEKILDKFLVEFSVVGDHALLQNDNDDDEEEKKLIMGQVHVGSVSKFLFELASDPETEDRYRKSLYDMHKTYVRRIKVVGTDVVMFDDDEGSGGGGSEEGTEDSSSGDAAVVVGLDEIGDGKNEKRSSESQEGDDEDIIDETNDRVVEKKDKVHKKKKKAEQVEKEDETTGETKKKKKKKSKKKKKESEEKDPAVKGDERMSTDEEQPATTKKEEAVEPTDNSDHSAKNEDEGQSSLSSSKKKRKKDKKKKKEQQQQSKDNDHKDKKEEEEMVVTISSKEQRKAAKEATKKQKKKIVLCVTASSVKASAPEPISTTPESKGKKLKKKHHKDESTEKEDTELKKKSASSSDRMDDDDDNSDDDEDNMDAMTPKIKKSSKKAKANHARVSFGKVNHSKSYKASMKALKTMDQPSTVCRTPDRSILLSGKKQKRREEGIDGGDSANDEGGSSMRKKKVKIAHGGGGGQQRKRAIDYF